VSGVLIASRRLSLAKTGRSPKAPSFSMKAPVLLLFPFGAGEVDILVAAGFPQSELFPLKGAFSHGSFESSRPPGVFIRALVHGLFSSVHGDCSAG
jgi:hypothetical protein